MEAEYRLDKMIDAFDQINQAKRIIFLVQAVFYESSDGQWVLRMKELVSTFDVQYATLIECIAMLRTTYSFRMFMPTEWNELLAKAKAKFPENERTFVGLHPIVV
jgi:hypothetical protein